MPAGGVIGVVVKQDRLDETQFTYKVTKDGTLFVYWHGKPVRTYAGGKAADILAEIDGPMLQHGLQEMDGALIRVPTRRELQPRPEYLEERFARFRAA